MPKETMTPRERWLAVLNREKPDRVPMDYWATEEASLKLMRYLRCDHLAEVYRYLHIDCPVTVAPIYVGGPPEAHEAWCSCSLGQYQTVEEIEHNCTWRSPDWWDYSTIPDQIMGKEDYPIKGGGSEPFLIYKGLRGMEQAYMDLILNPEIVHYCLDKLFDFCYENTRRIFEQIPGQVMICYVAEDLGAQETLLFSRDQFREFLLPRMKRMIDLAHQAGAYVFHHSDGAVRETIPDMIDAGIDVLNPIQWRCKGMEREGLKRDFGDKIIFHGAMDNQYTLPFGTVEEVRQEVLDNLRILGQGGGYILAPCHNIQDVGPPENIVAMYEAGYEYGWT